MSDQTRVLYNGECPVCSREINHYAAYASPRNLPLRFDDLTDADALAQWGVAPEEAARRLHVLKDGQLHIGLAAFLVLWAEMPRYRWLARLFGAPVIRPLASAAYDHLLAPVLFRAHTRRVARKARLGKP